MTLRLFALFLLLSTGTPVFAAGVKEVEVVQTPEPPPEIEGTEPGVRSLLYPYNVSGTLGLGIPAPFKYGLGFSYIHSSNQTFEISHVRGGLSFGVGGIALGGFEEGLTALAVRYFPSGKSFHYILGLTHQTFRVHFGNDMVARMTGGPGSLDFIRTQTLGLQAGVGNQWYVNDHFWIGVDWFVLNVPLVEIQSESPAAGAYTNNSDRTRVEDVLSLLIRIPTANILKTSLGYSF